MITVNLMDLLVILGCALIVALIVLVCHLIKTVKNINEVIEKNEPHITNTLTNVDKMGTDTKDIYTRITEKVLTFISDKMDKKAPKATKTKLDKE
jgi:uncharacterized protein YoxC